MATKPVVILGAGGFGREALDVIDAVNAVTSVPVFEFVGFLDDGHPDLDLLDARGVKYLGPVSALTELPGEVEFLIGVGNGGIRRKLDDFGRNDGRGSPVLVHPSATFGFDVRLGPGTVVCSHVSMTTNIRVGRHVHLNLNSTVGHDVRISDYVTVSPLVAISGAVSLGPEVLLGTGSSVNQGLAVGQGAVIGAGAAAVRDIPVGAVAVGVPAKPR